VYLTDTHCHLNHEQFEPDCADAVARAIDANVRRMLVVGYDLESSLRAVTQAARYPEIEAVIGIHPEAAALTDPESVFAQLTKIAQTTSSRVVAWGEIGLDYYWKDVPRVVQLRTFLAQVALAEHLALPVVIHCRDAYSDLLDILVDHPTLRAELHCFTGTRDEADRAISQGLYLGAGGIATYKKSEDLRATLAAVPIDRILLETDSPYLAPQAHRGKRNEPAYIVDSATVLADLRAITVDELASITTANAERFFRPPRSATASSRAAF